MTPRSRLDTYMAQAHRVQTAIATLIATGYVRFIEPKHLRTGIDMSKSDHAALVKLLVARGIFTIEEYEQALNEQAKLEADSYEKTLQSVLSSRNITTT